MFLLWPMLFLKFYGIPNPPRLFGVENKHLKRFTLMARRIERAIRASPKVPIRGPLTCLAPLDQFSFATTGILVEVLLDHRHGAVSAYSHPLCALVAKIVGEYYPRHHIEVRPIICDEAFIATKEPKKRRRKAKATS